MCQPSDRPAAPSTLCNPADEERGGASFCYTAKSMKKITLNMISESEFTVQGHGVHTAYVELTNALKRRDDVSVRVNGDIGDDDVVHIQTLGLYSLKRLLRAPGKKVVSVHVVPDSFVGSIVLAKYWRPIGRAYLKWFYGRADMLFAVSQMVADELVGDMQIPAEKVKLLYNTVDMQQYRRSTKDKAAARRQHEIAKDAFVVVGNGQVQPRKRFDTFVAAAHELPEVQFIWIGGIPFKHLGADYAEMNRLIETAPPNLKVTGVIPLADVRAYLHAADVFFLPAEQENHPMAVLEAAGTGLPIILRDIPQYKDTFARDAELIETNEQAVATIRRLRDDRAAYDRAAQGAAAIAARFDSAAGAERAMTYYREAMARD